MTEPAVLQATYSDFKYIKTRKVISLSFEIPVEHDKIVQDVLGGMPRPDAERWVAIAVLNGARLKAEPVQVDAAEKASNPRTSRTPPKGPHSDYAQALYKCRFMWNLNVCQALGTEADYKAWIQKQDSCVSGKQDYIGMESGEMRCEESHVERVSEGHGKGIKAPYHSVPLTHEEHRFRHAKGDLALLNRNKPLLSGTAFETDNDWFEKYAIEYREKWVHERLLDEFSALSLTDIHPEDIQKWAEFNGVEEALPK